MNVQNVKIITVDGRGNLQEPVHIAEEKASIWASANRITKSEHVGNQQEVKLTAAGRN